MIAILHNIRSNHNVGSIFRSADALGVSELYLCGITPTPVDRFGRENKQLTKVSLNAEKHVNWEHCDSTIKLLDKLKQEEYNIAAIELNKDSASLSDFKSKSKKLALVFGNEVEGLSQDILDKSDVILEIPMRGKKESLNVAVTFGIAAYQLNKV